MKKTIGNLQLSALIFSGIVGLSLNIPKDFGRYSGTGGWTAAIINALMVLFPGLMIISMNMKREDKPFYEYLEDITGKYISKVILFIYFLRFLLLGSLVTRALLQVVKATILEKTPYFPLAVLFIFCTWHAATKGLRALSNVAQFFIMVLMFLSVLILTSMFSTGAFINLQPIFVKEDIPVYLRDGIKNIRSFLGIDILLLVPLSKSENKNAKKVLILSLAAIALFYIISFEATVAVSGIDDTILYDDIFLLSVRRVEIEGFEILKRLDGFAISNFIISIFLMVSIDLYGAGVTLGSLLKKMGKNNKKINLPLLISSVLAFIICILIPDALMLRRYFVLSLGLGIITCFGIPTILFILDKVRKNGKENK